MQTITKTVEVKLTPEDVARLFCQMNNEEQAQFFNEIAEVVETWTQPFAYQLQAIANAPELTQKGRGIMAQIGNYDYTNNPEPDHTQATIL